MDTSHIKFSQRLRYLIDRKKIDQVSVAKAIGIDRAQVSKWLSETVGTPRRTTLQKLADFFGCNIEWLATGKGKVFPPKPAATSPEATDQPESNSQIKGTEEQVLQTYQKLARLDSDFLLEVQSWIKEEEAKRPGFPAWFRLEFENRFPEFIKWQEEKAKKVA